MARLPGPANAAAAGGSPSHVGNPATQPAALDRQVHGTSQISQGGGSQPDQLPYGGHVAAGTPPSISITSPVVMGRPAIT
jgi:hypothetical protein